MKITPKLKAEIQAERVAFMQEFVNDKGELLLDCSVCDKKFDWIQKFKGTDAVYMGCGCDDHSCEDCACSKCDKDFI